MCLSLHRCVDCDTHTRQYVVITLWFALAHRWIPHSPRFFASSCPRFMAYHAQLSFYDEDKHEDDVWHFWMMKHRRSLITWMVHEMYALSCVCCCGSRSSYRDQHCFVINPCLVILLIKMTFSMIHLSINVRTVVWTVYVVDGGMLGTRSTVNVVSSTTAAANDAYTAMLSSLKCMNMNFDPAVVRSGDLRHQSHARRPRIHHHHQQSQQQQSQPHLHWSKSPNHPHHPHGATTNILPHAPVPMTNESRHKKTITTPSSLTSSSASSSLETSTMILDPAEANHPSSASTKGSQMSTFHRVYQSRSMNSPRHSRHLDDGQQSSYVGRRDDGVSSNVTCAGSDAVHNAVSGTSSSLERSHRGMLSWLYGTWILHTFACVNHMYRSMHDCNSNTGDALSFFPMSTIMKTTPAQPTHAASVAEPTGLDYTRHSVGHW